MPYNYFGAYNNPYAQYYQNNQQYSRPISLEGKIIDNLDAVKVLDARLDGSTSYYPLADGTAIATKQLQQDGTSRIIIYRPDIKEKEEVKYLTENDIKDIREELAKLKNKIEGGNSESE